jgi:hypothetical protein
VDALEFFTPPPIAATAVMRRGKAEIVRHKSNAFDNSVLEEFKNPVACRLRPEMDAQVKGLRSASYEVRQDEKQLARLPGPESSSSFAAQTYINQVYFSKAGHQVIEQRKKEGLPFSVPAGQPPSSASTVCTRVPLSMISGQNRAAESTRPSSGNLIPKSSHADRVSEMRTGLKKSLSGPGLAKAAAEIAEKQKRASFQAFSESVNRRPTRKFGSMLHNDLASLFRKRKSQIDEDMGVKAELFGVSEEEAEEQRKSLHCAGGRVIENLTSNRTEKILASNRVYRHSLSKSRDTVVAQAQ